MKKFRLIWVLASLVCIPSLSAYAQSQGDMRLNEYLIVNTTDFQDDFGQHNGWFELFNTSYGTVDIGGCYISNDPDNLKKYIIPKGDVLTKIKPRQHILFWADNQPFRGTFHVNFTLAESDTIYFVASDGRTILDRIEIRKDLPDNKSFGRSTDGNGEWCIMDHTSPSTNNSGTDNASKSSVLKEKDPNGLIMTLTAMAVVFTALILLSLIFKLTGTLAIRKHQKNTDEAMAGADKQNVADVAETSSETYAAIAAALHLYIKESEAHDNESFTITLNHTDRSYSPWSSKIYTLRQTPSVKKNNR